MVLKVELSQMSYTIQRMTELKLDTPQVEIVGITLTLTSLTMPPATYLNDQFVTDGKRVALLPNHLAMPTLECETKEAASEFNRSCKVPPSMCQCHPANNKIVCVCEEYRPLSHLRDRNVLLPQRVGNVVLKQQNGTVYTNTQLANMQMQLSLDGFSLKTEIVNSKCVMQTTPLKGCGDCETAAELTYTCRTNLGESIGHVDCKSTKFAVHCDTSGTLRKTYLSLPSGKFEETCRLRCPNSTSSVKIEGFLHLASDIDQVVDHLVSSNSTETKGSFVRWLEIAKSNIFAEAFRVWSLFVLVWCVAFSVAVTLIAI